jgi:hypothetical protein
MKQTKQVVHAIMQSILLGCLWYKHFDVSLNKFGVEVGLNVSASFKPNCSIHLNGIAQFKYLKFSCIFHEISINFLKF